MGKRPFPASVRSVAATLGVSLLCTTGSCRGLGTPSIPANTAARARNVLLVTIDTLRADRVGADGGQPGVTPAIDALAQSGATFLDATAHAPLTLPSHTSILTGRYPPGHGVHDNGGFHLGDDVPTLATVLHDRGFHTAAFVSSFVLRASAGLARGFDRYDDRFEGLGRAHQTASALERRGPETARAAAQWLASADSPFFLWVHFYDPHAPYDPPPAFASKFPGRPYDAEVAAADFALSTVLAALTPERVAQTAVIVTGDHGESLGEHGESEHGMLLYDATLHVPLVISGPGVGAGVRVERQVRHVDLLPTIADLVGVPVPAGGDGVSLIPLVARSPSGAPPNATPPQPGVHPMTTASSSDRDPVASYAESRFAELHFGWAPLRSLRDGTWKYIAGPAPELFMLTADRGERDNRRDARADTAAGMARVLAALAGRETAGGAKPTVDADAAERLRSLGYVSGEVSIGAPGADPNREIARYETYVKAFNAGLASLELGDTRAAESAFRRLAHECPLAFEPHQYLARTLAARRAFGEAAAEFDVALRLSPREAAVYFDAARALADGAQFDRAFALVAQGRGLEPASYSGALSEGLIARAAGQNDRAERALHEAITLNPTLSVAHLELGRLAEARGERDAARREYQRALDGDAMLAAARDALERLSR